MFDLTLPARTPLPQPPFLPTTRAEMDAIGWDSLDILLVTGDAYVDHPSFGVPLLGRWLVGHGYRVGIVAQPRWKDEGQGIADLARMGRPRLFAGVSAGALDSMLAHYTAFRKKRHDDAYTPGGEAGSRPNRAVIVYAGLIRKAFPGYIALGYDGPEMDAATGTAYFGIAKNMVLFSKKRYELLAAGTYWLSETPLIGGSMSWETARARHFNWVRLRDRRTGKEFRVASIHLDHISQQARTAQIEAFIAEAAQYPAGFPQILAGDFNSKPGNPVMEALEKAGWHDAWPEANGADAVREPSFHGFKGEMYKAKGKPGPIDFIFLKGAGIKAVESHLVKDSVKGILPSDHYFLSADIVIE